VHDDQAGHPNFPTLGVKGDSKRCWSLILGPMFLLCLVLGPSTNAAEHANLSAVHPRISPSPILADDSYPETTDLPADTASPFAETDAATPQAVRPRRWSLPIIGSLTLLLLVSFFAIEPVITTIGHPQRLPLARITPGWPLLIQQRSLEALTCAWFFMLGASLGSFVHCLEYRWPRSISVVARGSACPGCGRAIRLWHNIPVFGWLYLRGRCARCGWEIPARYAITELVLGTVFVGLLALELIGGGLNLPAVYASRYFGVTENVWDPNWRLIGIFAWHAALLTFLTTLSLFAWDRFGASPWLVAIALTVGIVGPLIWPGLQVVQWDDLVSPAAGSRIRVAGVGQLAGGTIGLLLGYCLVRRAPGNIRAGDTCATLLAMLLVGLYLGWQAALAIAALTVAVRILLCVTAARSWPVTAAIAVATLIHLLSWRWLLELPVYPLLHERLIATFAAIVAVPVLAALVDSLEHGGDAGPTIIEPQKTSDTDPAAVSPIAEDSIT
jgi:leader peptidase (prepilin peptidase)/N-methyltransferase